MINRVLADTARIIEDLEITQDEFWKAVDYINRLGGRHEAGLLVAGLGLEHYLDLLQDARTNRKDWSAAPRAPSKVRCTSPARQSLRASRAWMTVAKTMSPL